MANQSQLPIIESLFDCLQDTVYFTKDIHGCYLNVNDTLVERCGLHHKSELIGQSPSQALGSQLGASYEQQDRHVIDTGDSIYNKLELHVYPNRKIGWCLTSKHALLDDQNSLIGVAGVSQDLRTPDVSNNEYKQLGLAIDHVMQNLDETPNIDALSEMTGLSAYQLDRRIKRIFGLTTGQWILKLRLDHARHQLTATDKPIAVIALDSGYDDQSAFTRQFRKATGFTPSQFRRS